MSSSTAVLEQQSSAWVTRLADYVQLSKPRIATLVLVVVATSGYVARWGHPNALVLLHAVLGTMLVASSASALNQLFERRRDGIMRRTANRPLPAGRLGSTEVVAFALVTVTVGLVYLSLAVNWLAAAWALATWLIYIGIYTPMKSHTAGNTLVGAIAGALPVFIGWSAVDGTLNAHVDPRGVALFLILFLWQFPHFMAIAWIYREQYSEAGMRMLTVVDATGRQAALQAVATALVLLPVSLVPIVLSARGGAWVYAVIGGLLGIAQLACSIQFLLDRNERTARRLLRATLLYLPALLICLVLATAG
jgi:protoheme IX farnesyltransferase